jgi:hypothetical protein
VLLVGYEEMAGSAMPMLQALGHACLDQGVDVLDSLVVRGGRWYNPDCDQGCCPPEGTPLPTAADTPAVADFVSLERAPLPGRDALADLVRLDVERSGEVARVLCRLGAAWPGQSFALRPADAEPDGARAVRRLAWLSLWAAVCDVSASSPPVEGLSADEVGQLALSLADTELRDGIIAWMCPGALPLDLLDEDLVDQLQCSLPEPAWGRRPSTRESLVAGRRLESRLAFVCRAVPDAQAPPLLTVLANFAWCLGNGALAREALDRALKIAPDYRLAKLLERMLDLAIRPRANA